MNIVVKVKCTCGTWVRIRDVKLPTHKVSCWKCNASIQLTYVNKYGGNAKIEKGGKTVTVSNVDVEALELP